MTRTRLEEVLDRLAVAPSLVNPDRVYTAGGNPPPLQGVPGYQLHWLGSALPWWLMPLRLIAAALRSLCELAEGDRVCGFVRQADPCFSVELYSCSRTIVPAAVAHRRNAGFMGNPGEIIDQEPTYFELQVDCDGGSHDSWQVWARCGSACPQDLATIARAMDDDDAPIGGQIMTKRSDTLLLWSPRVLGILVCLFLSLFALDAFGGGKTFVQALPDFLIHIAPMGILLGVVALSWRWEWIGGLVFTALAGAYAYLARRHAAWIPTISGPLLVVGVLFFWSWVHRHKLRHAS